VVSNLSIRRNKSGYSGNATFGHKPGKENHPPYILIPVLLSVAKLLPEIAPDYITVEPLDLESSLP